MIEIERKFLVSNEDFKKEAFHTRVFKQGYLNSDPLRSVRVRIDGEQGILTVKGPSSADGTSRLEWERLIPLQDAEALLPLCEHEIINKTRYEIKVGLHVYEVDIFEGSNAGLILAELELNDPEEDFEKPDWLGQEVTGDIRYYNSQLAKKPFLSWENQS
ncbi:CYTH domain-containing protein [Croceiramulus getboli]|nr:CYTH domain-containing protein [Flavobacteriaceae bacterium YJPT1-3]